MSNKILRRTLFYLSILVITLCLVMGVYSKIQEKAQSENLETVYYQSIEFLNDFYSGNIDKTFDQLESRSILANNYMTKEQWESGFKEEVKQQPLVRIKKPTSVSDVSYSIQSDEPHETYIVDVTLYVKILGKEVKRTGKIEYIKTDEGFKIHNFEMDIIGENARTVYY